MKILSVSKTERNHYSNMEIYLHNRMKLRIYDDFMVIFSFYVFIFR